jgi:RNA chaperone Hfq
MKTKSRVKRKERGANGGRIAQDGFLTEMMDQHKKVAIVLRSGLKLDGKIAAFDQYMILLKAEATVPVYKRAVASVQPIAAIETMRRGRPQANTSEKPIIIRQKKRVLERPE